MHKYKVIPSTLHRMIKFRRGDDIIVVMVENLDRQRFSSVSPQTVYFDSKPFDILYHINRFEPVNFIPDLKCVSRLTAHGSPFWMVENLCCRWNYEKGASLGRYG